MPTITAATKTDRTQIALNSAGLLAETWPWPSTTPTLTSPTSQAIYGCLVGLRAGDVVSKIVVNVGTAGAGTVPTSLLVGIADTTGKVLAQSAELKSDAGWTSTGFQGFALSASYTVPSDGGYYLVVWKNGTFGTTDVALARSFSTTTATGGAAYGSNAQRVFLLAGQASFPATGSTISFTAGAASVSWWMAAA